MPFLMQTSITRPTSAASPNLRERERASLRFHEVLRARVSLLSCRSREISLPKELRLRNKFYSNKWTHLSSRWGIRDISIVLFDFNARRKKRSIFFPTVSIQRFLWSWIVLIVTWLHMANVMAAKGLKQEAIHRIFFSLPFWIFP